MPVRYALAALILTASPALAQDFPYLTRVENGFEAQHTLRLRFEADESWRAAEPVDRAARFNDVPFEITLSAFLRPDAAIMVHAEHVADLSGASNYDRFPETAWPTPGFRGEGLRCHDIPSDVVEGEHDLAWLRDNGFNPAGSMWIEQHFLSGNAYNDEIVISLITRGASCDEADRPQARFDEMHAVLMARPLSD
ncbi:hypothetical protein [Maricaulis parjimensis]|uniref:hypothetical protein n=1 Tax=Maricaulis parjimensis TaxID=144023 RepID=UPI0019399A2A|nr:hypothetical protein [Maricaulis parjimensis]